jgi:hypothetical protein
MEVFLVYLLPLLRRSCIILAKPQRDAAPAQTSRVLAPILMFEVQMLKQFLICSCSHLQQLKSHNEQKFVKTFSILASKHILSYNNEKRVRIRMTFLYGAAAE